MSEYRNDPPIDFMLDKDSKDSEDYANRYDQHIHAMTAERLNSKSDIAWELTIRDQRIAELEERIALYQKWRDTADKAYDKLEAQNKRLVELLKTSVAEFDDGIKYPLEVVNDLKQVLASMEER